MCRLPIIAELRPKCTDYQSVWLEQIKVWFWWEKRGAAARFCDLSLCPWVNDVGITFVCALWFMDHLPFFYCLWFCDFKTSFVSIYNESHRRLDQNRSIWFSQQFLKSQMFENCWLNQIIIDKQNNNWLNIFEHISSDTEG